MSKEDGISLIYNFVDQSGNIKDGLEPFPISLRGINWIKFLSKYKIEDQKISDSLYAQYFILMDNIEYHILGNHLLENGFSLLFGAYYFQNEDLYLKGKEILTDELEEQILKDGAHFELSPMYHQIMLFRVLDCINLVQNNNWKDQELLELLTSKAKLMLDWLNTITFENGDIPLLNDSANKIAPTTEQLNDYASTLQIANFHQPSQGELSSAQEKDHLDGIFNHQLNESGYRKFKNENYECIVDVGHIGPDYIPGHAHSDTFSFELHVKGKPFIVDSGLSTYETNKRRTQERSTASHNTVEIDGLDQSEVWGGFRVANRAYVTHIEVSSNTIKATHNGYEKRLGILHTREFIFENDTINILDNITSKQDHHAIARIHFHFNVDEEMILNYIETKDVQYEIKDYYYAPEFNLHVKAKVLELYFSNKLEIKIKI